jgi:hypothetical protein
MDLKEIGVDGAKCGLGYELLVGYCENGSEHSISIKFREFF